MVKELIEKHEDKFHRFFEMVPGALTWAVLLSPIWLGKIAPQVVIFFLTFLAIFWVYRAFIHLVGVLIGYRRYKRENEVDWFSGVQDLWGFENLKHLIIIPAVSENYEVLQMANMKRIGCRIYSEIQCPLWSICNFGKKFCTMLIHVSTLIEYFRKLCHIAKTIPPTSKIGDTKYSTNYAFLSQIY